MKRVVLAAMMIASLATGAQAESYTAISNTAMSITGDIVMDDYGITFANGTKLEFADLVAYELEVGGQSVEADIYEVATPADPALLNGNKLCGSGDVTYVARWTGDFGISVAVFSTADVPASDSEMCASYSYE